MSSALASDRVASLGKSPKRERRSESRLERGQVKSAVQALLAYQSKAKEKEALDLGADVVTVQIGLKKALGASSNKPKTIVVPHALRERPSVCLLVKDADKPWIKALSIEGQSPGAKRKRTELDGTRAAKMARRDEPLYETKRKNGAEESGESCVAKVIALSKLRTSYARFQSRRELRDSYDVFLADDRIVPMLTKTLGSTFFSRKAQPVAVDVTRPAGLTARITQAARHPILILKKGNCIAINLAHTDMPVDHVVDNVCDGVAKLVQDYVPKQWSGVLNVHLKLPASVALPVWNARFALHADSAAPTAGDVGPTSDGCSAGSAPSTSAAAQDGEANKLSKKKKPKSTDEKQPDKIVRKKKKSSPAS